MVHRRVTPNRRREACPDCGRDTAYTNPWVTVNGEIVRSAEKSFISHNDPKTGKPCKQNERF